MQNAVKPKRLDQVREKIRVKHYSMRGHASLRHTARTVQ